MILETARTLSTPVYSKIYDILLLDIKTPKKNGMEVLSELRKAKLKTPVIFISSIIDMEQLEKSYEAGCCDYVRKPFEGTSKNSYFSLF